MSNFKLCVRICCRCDYTVLAFVFCLCDENKNNLKCFPNALIFLEDMSAQIKEKKGISCFSSCNTNTIQFLKCQCFLIQVKLFTCLSDTRDYRSLLP